MPPPDDNCAPPLALVRGQRAPIAPVLAEPTLEYTEFPDVRAMSRKTLRASWPEFVRTLESPPLAASKDKQPLLKLATFGERRNEVGCYRTDANVDAITGVEGDYDAGVVSIEDAVALLEKHGIRGVVYSSWNHKPETPRWRVLCPTSKALEPGERARLVARVNGALGGVLAVESFVLSQIYYFGQSAEADYLCLTTFCDPDEGSCIDELDSLDEIAVGKPSPATSAPARQAPRGGDSDWLADLLDGDDVHGNALRVVGRMVAKGLDNVTIKAVLKSLSIPVAQARGPERARELLGPELDRMIGGARNKGWAPIDHANEFLEISNAIVVSNADEVSAIEKRIARAHFPKAAQEDMLIKLLKQRHGIMMGSIRKDIAVEKAEHARELRGGGPAPKEPDQSTYAASVVERLGADNVKYALGCFWLWDNSGVWRKADDREVKQVAQNVLDSDEHVSVSKGLIDGVVDNVKNTYFTKAAPFDSADWRLVNVSNGTLEFSEATGAWGLREHRREDFLTTQLPIPYDPSARAPRFERFLVEVFAGDPDANDKAACVWELLGYSLLTTCRFEKFVLLIGGGANGKSVLLSVVEALVGHANVAAVQPAQFDNKFQRAHLHGKLVNIVTEIAEGSEIPDADLKAITSGELMTAEHKNRDPFNFRPFATCWFGTNHLPHTRDFSQAMFRRAVVLEFNNTFEAPRCDPGLKERLIAEAPGILVLALGGLTRAIVRNGIAVPPSSISAGKAWRRDVDQVAQFVEDCCVAAPGAGAPSSNFYREYQSWATSAGVKRSLSRKSFTTRLVALGGQRGKGGHDGTRMIYGWSLRSPMDPYSASLHPLGN